VLLRGNSRNVNIFLSIFLAPKIIKVLIIRHIVLSLNITEKNTIAKHNNIWLYSNLNTGHFSQGCGVCSCSLLAETNNAILKYLLLPSLASKVQKTFSPGLELRTVFWGCGLRSCSLLAKTNNFGLAVLRLYLVSKLQKPSSPRLKHRTGFRISGLDDRG
jgi:hypothetical protein